MSLCCCGFDGAQNSGRERWYVDVLESSKNSAIRMKPYMARRSNGRALKQERNVCGVSQRRRTHDEDAAIQSNRNGMKREMKFQRRDSTTVLFYDVSSPGWRWS